MKTDWLGKHAAQGELEAIGDDKLGTGVVLTRVCHVK